MTKKAKDAILKKSELNTALSALISDYELWAPAGEAERHAFTLINERNLHTINLAGNPVVSPKEIFLPRTETLYTTNLRINQNDNYNPSKTDNAKMNTPGTETNSSKTDSGDYSISQEVIFGMRPCDARGIANIDRVFIDEKYTDSLYAERRENLTVISLACTEIPSPACFCDSMGGGPASDEGADVMLRETESGDEWIVTFVTEKGHAIEKVWSSAGVLTESGGNGAAVPTCTLTTNKPDDLPQKLTAAFDDPAWTRFSEACIGCGTCSFICPTCYCFDMDTEKQNEEAQTFRCWDCCMFSDYSRMAGGHNPRPTKKERLRNRYLHKLAYFDERYGKTLCTGCGRCIEKCPAGLDIVSIIEWGATL